MLRTWTTVRMSRTGRTRKDPQSWSDADISDSFVTAYLGSMSIEGHLVSTAGIVLHAPAAIMPKQILRLQRKHFGEWRDWQVWLVVWDEYLWNCVLMGDEPIDLVKSHCASFTEDEARKQARELAEDVQIDVGYLDLPAPARQTLGYAVRKGRGYFFN